MFFNRVESELDVVKGQRDCFEQKDCVCVFITSIGCFSCFTFRANIVSASVNYEGCV